MLGTEVSSPGTSDNSHIEPVGVSALTYSRKEPSTDLSNISGCFGVFSG